MRGPSAYFVLFDEIADFTESPHPCQYEYIEADDGITTSDFCEIDSVGHFDARGWLCKWHAAELDYIDYTDY